MLCYYKTTVRMRSFLLNICLEIRTFQISPTQLQKDKHRDWCVVQRREALLMSIQFNLQPWARNSLSLSLSLYLSCCYLGLPRVYPKLRHVVRLRHPLSLALLLVRVEACQGGGWGPSHPSHHVNSITYRPSSHTENLDAVSEVPEEGEV